MTPRVLRNFSLSVDGYGFLGRVEELTLPKLSIKSEEYRAGGMDVPAEIDLGMEKLEAGFTVLEYDPVLYRQFGLLSGASVPIRFRGAQQGADGVVVPMLIAMCGIYKELDGGSWKAGDKGSLKATVSCRYYRLEINARTVIEIDVDNMTRIIDGVDQLAAVRAAIGF